MNFIQRGLKWQCLSQVYCSPLVSRESLSCNSPPLLRVLYGFTALDNSVSSPFCLLKQSLKKRLFLVWGFELSFVFSLIFHLYKKKSEHGKKTIFGGALSHMFSCLLLFLAAFLQGSDTVPHKLHSYWMPELTTKLTSILTGVLMSSP